MPAVFKLSIPQSKYGENLQFSISMICKVITDQPRQVNCSSTFHIYPQVFELSLKENQTNETLHSVNDGSTSINHCQNTNTNHH